MAPFAELDCEEALASFHDCLDDDLPAVRRPLALNVHLADCASCRERCRGLEEVHRAGRLLSPALPALPAWNPRTVAAAAMLMLAVGIVPPTDAGTAGDDAPDAPLLDQLAARAALLARFETGEEQA